MKYTLAPLKCLFLLTCFITGNYSFATNSKVIEEQADSSIKKLYHTLNTMPNSSMPERIDWISSYFKGSPYLLGALGEGYNARFDQFPLYRVDGFDCDTYVNTVISLAVASSLQSFQQCLNYSRYQNGEISYIHRNHFTSIDWNKNNQLRGLLKDITLTITEQNKESVAIYANAIIDKPSWYEHKNIAAIRLTNESNMMQEQRLVELKALGSQLKITPSKIPYIPLTALFSDNSQPNLYLFSQIPHGSIIEIVRPNWDLRKQIGTALNVSHLGFAVWINKQLYFRQASSKEGKVVDVPLIEYLKEARKSPTIKGINVQIILPQKPVSSGDCGAFGAT